jgi:hypothetical protein
LSQAAYARKILERAGMGSCNPCHTPMEHRLKLLKQSTMPEVNATEYRDLVGCLRYLVHTRPDIAFTIGYVSRFMERPTTEHLNAVKRVLHYIAGTLNFSCHYRRGWKELHLLGYNNADMGGDIDTRKSMTGIVFYVESSPLTWQSQKQKVAALSSYEVEYIIGMTAACQGICLARLLAELKHEPCTTFLLKLDSQSAIALNKNPVFYDRSKHIDVRFHASIRDGRMDIEHIRTEEKVAEILTKPLARERFCELRDRGDQDQQVNFRIRG